jgi:hypothetical protein
MCGGGQLGLGSLDAVALAFARLPETTTTAPLRGAPGPRGAVPFSSGGAMALLSARPGVA